MSRIGKQAIEIPAGVEVSVKNREVNARGPQGSLSLTLPPGTAVEIAGGKIAVSGQAGDEYSKYHGLARTLVANLVSGVSEGFVKTLEIVGVGYRAEVSGDKLVLSVGLSHPVRIGAPAGISFAVEKNTITISGASKELVGNMAAAIRATRPPEPYKGKGIKYSDERIRRKAGKSAGKEVKAAG